MSLKSRISSEFGSLYQCGALIDLSQPFQTSIEGIEGCF